MMTWLLLLETTFPPFMKTLLWCSCRRFLRAVIPNGKFATENLLPELFGVSGEVGLRSDKAQ